MNASGRVPGCAMIKSDMYENYKRWFCHKYYVNYMIMQSNMTMMERVIINGTVESCNTPDVTFHICNSNSCHFGYVL